jgi:hypothetical protein
MQQQKIKTLHTMSSTKNKTVTTIKVDLSIVNYLFPFTHPQLDIY